MRNTSFIKCIFIVVIMIMYVKTTKGGLYEK